MFCFLCWQNLDNPVLASNAHHLTPIAVFWYVCNIKLPLSISYFSHLLQDQCQYKETASLFEHFFVVGLHSYANVGVIEDAFAKKKAWESNVAHSEIVDLRKIQYHGRTYTIYGTPGMLLWSWDVNLSSSFRCSGVIYVIFWYKTLVQVNLPLDATG